MGSIQPGEDTSRERPIRELLAQLVEEKKLGSQKAETEDTKKSWKWPMKWKSKMNRSTKKADNVLVFYLNIKGEIETPVIVPLYSGNMVIIRNKVYEVDPRAFWTVRLKANKMYKVLLIKEIDRRPVSNLDYAEIRKRGDATDSDEFLIKAALKAQTSFTKRPVNKWVIILIVVIAVASLGWFLIKGGG